MSIPGEQIPEDPVPGVVRQRPVQMMAYGVHPPSFLDLSSKTLPEDFADFRQAWDIYVIAAEIIEKSDMIKVALLKNFLGTDTVKVLNTLLAAEAQATPAAILTALEGYCLPQVNGTYERYIFNTAMQQEEEDINKFVTRLRKLAKTWYYGQLKNSLIRDQIVVGIRSDDTRKALLKMANLDLTEAIDTCRAQKLVEDRMAMMKIKEEPRDSETSAEVIAKVNINTRKKYDTSGEVCKFCGRKDHKIGDRESCPANGVTCRKCLKLNHYARVCRAKISDDSQAGGSRDASSSKSKNTRKVKTVEQKSDDSDEADYITSVEEVNVVEKKITVMIGFTVQRGETPKKIRCQVDTGASCSVVDRKNLKELMGKVTIEPSKTKFRGFGGQIVSAYGKVVLRHESHGKAYKVVFQVVDLGHGVLKMPLLGYKTCMALGIVSVQEVMKCEAQAKLQQALHGLKGIEVLVDDILCVERGSTDEEAIVDHNRNLEALLQRRQSKGIELNRSKSKMNQIEVRFFGHVLSRDGLKPDPSKTAAISEMPQPRDAAELQRFLGLATYMAKFISKLSELSRPLREVLVSEEWHWGKQQAEAYRALKQKIAEITVLKYYNPKLEATIQCDASSYAVGAVLLQEGQPVIFASRTLTATEQTCDGAVRSSATANHL
ncbi:uncharacterized protein LOC129719680 [Wyeomyia smithii]|uniref:uncharacterized protein LOC129719680 n=1 Tax=Wyeomyia smithii TaxID=174621 RepID=UPI002467F4FA|nr:uncharacterized protein LOC129719680 [Wyeomyia smithii]